MPSVVPGLVRVLFVNRARLCVGRCDLARRTASRCDLRQPEIENLGVPALGDKNVGGLDVAVDDSLRSGQHRARRQSRWPDRVEHRSPAGFPAMRCFSVTPSRNSMAMNDWPSCFADVVDRADVGMVQSRCSPSLAAKAFQRLRVLGDVVGQELQATKRPSSVSSAL